MRDKGRHETIRSSNNMAKCMPSCITKSSNHRHPQASIVIVTNTAIEEKLERAI